MTGGAWLDLLLVALLGGSLALLYRLQASRTVLAAEGADLEEAEGGARPRGRLARLMRQAGFEPGALRWIFWAGKVALAALAPLAVLALWAQWSDRTPWVAAAFAALLGFFLPDLLLLSRRRARRRRIRAALSYFLDLLVALLHSGLNLEQAFRRAARDGLEPSHPLAEEAALVARELDLGREQAPAFRAMAERSGVHELEGVAVALASGARLGASVDDTLRAQADLMRTRRAEAARRAINLAALKTLFPVFLCGFPIFLVIVLLPVVLELAEIFGDLLGLL